jgi:hypothetical protein
MKITSDRSGYAPGEVVTIRFDHETDWDEFESRLSSISVDFNQNVALWADRYHSLTYSMLPKIIVPKGQKYVSFAVPPVPPTYTGGLGKDSAWFGKVSRYGNRWGTVRPDPITWTYSLVVTLTIKMPGFVAVETPYSVIFPIGVSGMGLAVLPPLPDYVIATPVMGNGVSPNPMASAPVPAVPMDRGAMPSAPAAPVNLHWQSDSRIVAAYPAVLSQCNLAPAFGSAELIRDPQEDHNNTNAQSLTYQPSYLMFPPSAPPAPPSATDQMPPAANYKSDS